MDSQNKLDEFLSKYKLPLAMGLVGLVLLMGGVISSGIIGKTFFKSTKYPSLQTSGSGQVQTGIVKVDVSGAVVNPGVYSLPSESRVEDAVKAAGGVLGTADATYLSKTINLAQKISDGMKIYVPKIAENSVTNIAGQSGSPAIAGTSKTTLVNINTASSSELDQLPGVGPVTAQNIIGKRPYSSIEELLTKKAVARSVYDKIKEAVSVY